MKTSPKWVHGFVLGMPGDQEAALRSKISNFFLRERNLRKRVFLHLSLLIVYLDEARIKRMLNFLSTYQPDFKRVSLTLGDPVAVGAEYLGFTVDSPQLREMHRQLIEDLKHITAGAYDPRYLELELKSNQREYLDKYGYHRVLEYFWPAHITIGMYENSQIRDEELALAPKISDQVIFDNLAFDQAGYKSQTPADILWRYPLQ